MKTAIIGHGYIGKGYNLVFPEAVIYDEPRRIGSKDAVNQCDLAIICVPTPMKENGECDISIVENVLCWLDTKLILIKSTIPPGTTDRFIERFKKPICFSPEYMGESKYFTTPWKYIDPKDPRNHEFQIIGGEESVVSRIVDIFIEKLGPEKKYYIVSAIEAEIIKYMENAFGATKVCFCQEFYDLCQVFGASYHKVREGFLLDNRVERMHTAVFVDSRKWGGKCWPKDVSAIIKAAEDKGFSMNLLKQVVKNNEKH